MFEKGGYIVYGTTGVCQIEDITGMKSKGASGEKLYYVLRPCFQKGNTIFTPVDNGKIAMRAAMTREEAEMLIKRIPQIEELEEADDKERERLYKEAIKSGKPGNGSGLSRPPISGAGSVRRKASGPLRWTIGISIRRRSICMRSWLSCWEWRRTTCDSISGRKSSCWRYR